MTHPHPSNGLISSARTSALVIDQRKAVKDAAVVARMRELSAQYPRYGYRRIRIFLGRDGHKMSPGRAYRLSSVLTGKLDLPLLEGATYRWSYSGASGV